MHGLLVPGTCQLYIFDHHIGMHNNIICNKDYHAYITVKMDDQEVIFRWLCGNNTLHFMKVMQLDNLKKNLNKYLSSNENEKYAMNKW